MNRIYISFGSNIGERHEMIQKAISAMNERGIAVIKISSLIETEPYGYTDQPPFLNGALAAQTQLTAKQALECLLDIEKELGRVRLFKWGPRVIDLDIIFFNDEIYNEEDMIIPHPDLSNREFVLKPLMEICPEYVHPVLKKTVSQLYEQLNKADTEY